MGAEPTSDYTPPSPVVQSWRAVLLHTRTVLLGRNACAIIPGGKVPEWTIGAVSKTAAGLCSAVGSNPTLPACPPRCLTTKMGDPVKGRGMSTPTEGAADVGANPCVRPESRVDTQVYRYRQRRKCRGEPVCSPDVKGRHAGLLLQTTPEMSRRTRVFALIWTHRSVVLVADFVCQEPLEGHFPVARYSRCWGGKPVERSHSLV